MNVVLIGLERFGRTWRKGLREVPGLKVVALVDVNAKALEEGREYFQLPEENCFLDPYTDWFQKVEADFVIDSTAHAFHYKNALNAFRAGMDVIVAKPMSDNLQCGQIMVEEAQKLGRKLVVAQQLRYFPPILKLKELLSHNQIGDIVYTSVDAFFPTHGPVREKWHQPYPMLVEAAIHHFDLVRWVLQIDAVDVISDNWNTPWIYDPFGKKCSVSVFTMTDGSKLLFRGLSTLQKGSSYPGTWLVEGMKGILELREDTFVYLDGEKIWPEKESKGFELDLDEYNKTVLLEAVAYFKGEREVQIRGCDNLKSLSMVYGSVMSFEKGERMQLDSL